MDKFFYAVTEASEIMKVNLGFFLFRSETDQCLYKNLLLCENYLL